MQEMSLDYVPSLTLDPDGQSAPAPAAIPKRKDAQTGIPQCTQAPAAKIAVNATTDPTDRSTPPVRITKSIPRDNKPIVVICRIRLVRLFAVKKTPFVSGFAIITRAITTKVRTTVIVTSFPPTSNRPRRIVTLLIITSNSIRQDFVLACICCI